MSILPWSAYGDSPSSTIWMSILNGSSAAVRLRLSRRHNSSVVGSSVAVRRNWGHRLPGTPDKL